MMIKNDIIKLSQLVLVVCLAFMMTGCRETIENIFSGDDEIVAGDEVMFTAMIAGRAHTRADGDYQVPEADYQFSIGMYTSDEKIVGDECIYEVIKGDKIGMLKAERPLYWPDTHTQYGFKATAGTATLESDQTTEDNLLRQDRLESNMTDYRSAKELKSTQLVSGGEDYKKIPLYMQHKRALITVVLKAGEGVSRQALELEAATKDITTKVFSYQNDTQQTINPLMKAATVDYDGEEVNTTCYEAIVEPYDYATNGESMIVQIRLSGQSFSFYAGNDNGDKSVYNLAAGTHLTITVTLGRDRRKILMTAQIEDWTEKVTSTICDDYGNAGEPIYIDELQELKDFLASTTNNKAGNVALVRTDLMLGDDWLDTYNLNATLNLGGHTLTSSKRFLTEIAGAANLQNGTIAISGKPEAAIAQTNYGTIEDVKIDATANSYATKAGAVVDNKGVISKCYSNLEVNGANGVDYVGGIAATSLSSGDKTAIINACTVTNRVGGSNVAGGIVGQASGMLSNNTFDYGITLTQSANHKNIVGANGGTLSASGNAWPTKATNEGVDNATPVANQYDGIIDCRNDFLEAAKYTSASYRLARNVDITQRVGNVAYQLDGNGKTINTETMVFSEITGSVSNLKVHVTKSLVSEVAEDDSTDTDYMAPFAYAVRGGKLQDIKVETANGVYIQAANPAGLVVWATGGATINNCEVKAKIVSKVKTKTGAERKYAGGIVSTVSNATISQCVLHTGSSLELSSESTGAQVVYFGGIVGGYGKYSNDAAVVTIQNCTNYVAFTETAYHGGILGYARTDAEVDSDNATQNCIGNWWKYPNDDTPSKGVAAIKTGTTADAVIGKRNAAPPVENNKWYDEDDE